MKSNTFAGGRGAPMFLLTSQVANDNVYVFATHIKRTPNFANSVSADVWYEQVEKQLVGRLGYRCQRQNARLSSIFSFHWMRVIAVVTELQRTRNATRA